LLLFVDKGTDLNSGGVTPTDAHKRCGSRRHEHKHARPLPGISPCMSVSPRVVG
jgi:hypothetical protein